MNVSFTKTASGNFQIFVNGVPHVVSPDHPMYAQIDLSLAHNDVERAVGYLNVPELIRNLSGDHLTLKEDGSVLSYQGYELESDVASTVLRFIHEDMPFLPLLNWLAKVVKNPSHRAQHELYPFMHRKVHRNGTEYCPLPITLDGDFLAYKNVRGDWTDHRTGKFCNKPGSVLEMPRNRVDDDCRNTCSNGFHVGSLSYAQNFDGFHRCKEPRIVVTVQSPEHVVSIPADHNATKCRVHKYRVLREFRKELLSPVYSLANKEDGTAELTPVQPVAAADSTSPALSEWDRPHPLDEKIEA